MPLALLLGLLLALSGASSASASAGEVLSRLNGARQASGLAPLSSSSDLDGVAQAWAQTMAWEGQLRHNPSLSTAVSGWSAIAENVGMGGSVSVVHNALMASSGHWANILGSYSQVGVGVASGNGSVWVVQVFRNPSGAPPPAPAPAPAPAAAPPPPPAAAPAPVSRPAAPVPARPAAPEASRSDVPTSAPAAPVTVVPLTVVPLTVVPVTAVPVTVVPVTADPAAADPAAPDATAASLEVSAAMRAVGGRGPWRISQPFVV